MEIRVGLAQIAPVLGDIQANLTTHLATIEAAVAAGQELLIFPELSLTGYHLREQAYELALRASPDEPVFAQLLAASQAIDLVVSFVEVDERYRYFITAAYLSGGRMVHHHRKVYLPTYGLFDEGRYFSPGHDVRSFETRFGRMGLLVCEDLWHAGLPYLLWLDGADILIGLSASVEHGDEQDQLSTADRVDSILRGYSILHTMFVLHANRAGSEEGLRFWGGSTVFEPNGQRLVQGPLFQPDLVQATLDTNQLRTARIDLPLLRDERPGLTARTLARILNEPK